MNLSLTTKGILVSLALPVLAKFGFSDLCSGEITSIVVPLLAALPGAAMAQYGRWRAGGVTLAGVRKPSVYGSSDFVA